MLPDQAAAVVLAVQVVTAEAEVAAIVLVLPPVLVATASLPSAFIFEV